MTSALLDAIDAIDEGGVRGRSTLDVGCGAGALTLAMLERGATTATGVDLGTGAIDSARTLARERGLADRAHFWVADGSTDPLTQHDVVTLNRVICCYPQMNRLLTNTLAATRHVYAFVVPRSTGWAGVVARTLIQIGNTVVRLRKRKYGDYQAYVHDVRVIDRAVCEAGFTLVRRRTVYGLWHLAVYQRYTAE